MIIRPRRSLMNQIYKLNQELSHYEYGYKINNKNMLYQDENFSLYRTISPAEFHDTRCGVCWDYVEYQALLFEQMGFRITLYPLENKEYSLYYMEHKSLDGCKPSHTWLGFKLDDVVYLFEASWKSIAGVRSFRNENKMIEYYIDQQVKHYTQQEGKGYLTEAIIIKFLKHTDFGKDVDTYMEDIHTTGNLILHI